MWKKLIVIEEEREENGKTKMEEYFVKLEEEGIQSIQILKCESDVE